MHSLYRLYIHHAHGFQANNSFHCWPRNKIKEPPTEPREVSHGAALWNHPLTAYETHIAFHESRHKIIFKKIRQREKQNKNPKGKQIMQKWNTNLKEERGHSPEIKNGGQPFNLIWTHVKLTLTTYYILEEYKRAEP